MMLYTDLKYFLILLLLMGAPLCIADTTIEFNGKFKDKAILLVNGKSHVLKTGETSPEGVKLISLDGDTILVEVEGKAKKLKLGDRNAIKTNFVESRSKEVIVSLNGHGQFITAGAINKQIVSLLIDTGANTVALNSEHAKKLGIDYARVGQTTVISTASGLTKAYRVTLDSVSIGEILLTNVAAVVIEGQYPAHILLGMSFLGNLEINREQQVMKIRKKW